NLPSRLLVSLNGAINVDENLPMKYSQEDFDRLGYTINRTSDGRVELLYPRFFEEMKTTLSRDIYDYRNPIMVCEGTGDPTLDPNVSYNFINNCNMDNVEHIFIEGANHTFHAKTRDYTLLNQLIDRLVPWIADRI
ncbi:MAG: hypothetical protein J5694_04350, partial [Erysipelotrichaceae bacterium]|nr:hypothetical protein [Erysipelotrichaceae bacterium]